MNLTISAGVHSSLLTVMPGSSLTVQSGGSVTSTTVDSGGTEIINAGGSAYFDIVSGVEDVLVGATVLDGQVKSGGLVSGPGTLVGTTISAGGSARQVLIGDGVVDEGGSVLGSTVISGGAVTVSDDGLVSNTLVSGSAAQVIVNSGVASNTDLFAGGDLSVNFFGSAIDVVVGASGTFDDDGDGDGITVYAGGEVFVQAGFATSMTMSGGFASAQDGGEFFFTTLLSGAVAVVQGMGGKALLTTISAGGELIDNPGGLDSGTLVSSGGTLIVSSGATTTGATVASGGYEQLNMSAATVSTNLVLSGGTVDAIGVAILDPFILFTSVGADTGIGADGTATLRVDSGSVLLLDNPTISSGGVLTLASGTHTTDAIVLAGGMIQGTGALLGDGATTDAGVVKNISLGDTSGDSAELNVLSGGVARAIDVVAAGDVVEVASGGEVISAILTGAQAQLIVKHGAVAADTNLAGADASVFGEADHSRIGAGGIEFVESGGLDSAAYVATGGEVAVASGGTTSRIELTAGATLSLASGAQAVQALVLAGGAVIDNGVATWSGASQTVFGGSLSGAGMVVDDGPGLLTFSGNETAFAGQLTLSGGVVELADAGGFGAAATIDFAATTTKKTLAIEVAPTSGGSFANALVDFDSSSATYVDLANVAFVSGATATLVGHTLTLHDGAYSASFTLSGQGASKYAVFSDGAGGTEIRAAVGSTITPLLVHAIAAFQPGAAAPATVAAGHADTLALVPLAADTRRTGWA